MFVSVNTPPHVNSKNFSIVFLSQPWWHHACPCSSQPWKLCHLCSWGRWRWLWIKRRGSNRGRTHSQACPQTSLQVFRIVGYWGKPYITTVSLTDDCSQRPSWSFSGGSETEILASQSSGVSINSADGLTQAGQNLVALHSSTPPDIDMAVNPAWHSGE